MQVNPFQLPGWFMNAPVVVILYFVVYIACAILLWDMI